MVEWLLRLVGSLGGQYKAGGRSASANSTGFMLPDHEPTLQQPPVADNISISAKMSISVVWSDRVDRIELAFPWPNSSQLHAVTRWNHSRGRLEWPPSKARFLATMARVTLERIAGSRQTRLGTRSDRVVLYI